MIAERVNLGSISQVITKGTTPTSIGFNFADRGIPFLRVNNIQNGSLLLEDVLFIDSKTDDALSRSKIEPRDVLISIAGTIGRTAVVPSNADEMNCNQAIGIIRLQENVDPHYVDYWLQTDDARRQIAGSKVTATISNLSLGCIKNLKIPLPPLSEQRRIAAILDKADSIRRKRKEAIALTEELLRSSFLDMFGDPVTNPVGWPIVLMKKVIRETQYGTSARANLDALGLPVLRMNNITYSGEIDLTDIKWCPIAQPDLAKYTVRKGDLLFNRTNSPELVGKTAVWPFDEEYAFAGYLVRVRFLEDFALPAFISGYLNSKYGKKYLFEKAKPSNNMSNFSASEFCKIPIILPPLKEQKKYADLVEGVRFRNAQMTKALESANSLFSGCIPTLR